MGKEIERKFLVSDPGAAIAAAGASVRIVQGYLSANPDATVRVRLKGEQGFITVKSRNVGAERGEWEYEIPAADARELLSLSVTPIIDKTRYLIDYEGYMWELDVFVSPRRLIVAEIELNSVDDVPTLPEWIAEEVTGNPQYYNSNITKD